MGRLGERNRAMPGKWFWMFLKRYPLSGTRSLQVSMFLKTMVQESDAFIKWSHHCVMKAAVLGLFCVKKFYLGQGKEWNFHLIMGRFLAVTNLCASRFLNSIVWSF